MGVISFTWDSGVFALRFDLSKWLKPKKLKKSSKSKGAKPLPPPFPLPPLKHVEAELHDAPLIEPPPPTMLMPTSPSVIVDKALTGSPDATVLMDDGEEATPHYEDVPTKELRVQRREVRRALAGVRR